MPSIPESRKVWPDQEYQAVVADNQRLRAALEFIAEMKGMTLIAPSRGPDEDNAHKLGAAKAFNQAADAAIDALEQ